MSAAGEPCVEMQRRNIWILAIFPVTYIILGSIHLLYGRLTGDEGWYALTARNVVEGMLPYRDFHLSQMPLVPYVYSVWFRIFGSSLEAGRCLSLIFGLTGLCLAMAACYRRAGIFAASICGALLGFSLHYVFDTVSFKTQPLTVMLISAAVFVLSKKEPNSRMVQMALAILIMTLAFLSRLSILPAVVLLWIYTFLKCRNHWPMIIGIILVDIAALTAVFSFLWSDGNMLFGIYQTHQEYFGKPPWSLERLIFYFLKGWSGNEMLVVFLLLWAFVCLAVRVWGGGLGKTLKDDDLLFELYLLGAYAGVSFLHVLNVQSHPIHQTSIVALAAALGAICSARFVESYDPRLRRVAFVSLLILSALCLPLQDWYVNWDGKGSMGRLDMAKKAILQNAWHGDEILSFNAELPVNTGLKSLAGYDMSEFTYFPAMDDARASHLKVTNFNKLLNDISSSRARILCVGDREFSIMAGGNNEIGTRLKEAIGANYSEVGKIDKYGQFYETMYIFVRKN